MHSGLLIYPINISTKGSNPYVEGRSLLSSEAIGTTQSSLQLPDIGNSVDFTELVIPIFINNACFEELVSQLDDLVTVAGPTNRPNSPHWKATPTLAISALNVTVVQYMLIFF